MKSLSVAAAIVNFKLQKLRALSSQIKLFYTPTEAQLVPTVQR